MDRTRVGTVALVGGLVVLVLSFLPVVDAAAPVLGGVVAATLYFGGLEHAPTVDPGDLTSPFDALTRAPVRQAVREGAVVGAAAGLAGAGAGLVIGAMVAAVVGSPGTPLVAGAAGPAAYLAAALLSVVGGAAGGVLAGATGTLLW